MAYSKSKEVKSLTDKEWVARINDGAQKLHSPDSPPWPIPWIQPIAWIPGLKIKKEPKR